MEKISKEIADGKKRNSPYFESEMLIRVVISIWHRLISRIKRTRPREREREITRGRTRERAIRVYAATPQRKRERESGTRECVKESDM